MRVIDSVLCTGMVTISLIIGASQVSSPMIWHEVLQSKEVMLSRELELCKLWKQRKDLIENAILHQGIKPNDLMYHALDSASKKYTPLSDAIAHGDADFVKFLLDHKADPLLEVPAPIDVDECDRSEQGRLANIPDAAPPAVDFFGQRAVRDFPFHDARFVPSVADLVTPVTPEPITPDFSESPEYGDSEPGSPLMGSPQEEGWFNCR